MDYSAEWGVAKFLLAVALIAFIIAKFGGPSEKSEPVKVEQTVQHKL